MAHECPICYQTCHCGGDIDDICLSGTDEEMMCTHCDDDDCGDDDEWDMDFDYDEDRNDPNDSRNL